MNETEPVTPGPWEASGPHGKGRVGSHVGRPAEWRYVQHNFPQHPYEGELSDEWGIYPPEGEAGPVALVAGESNAKLIAAAPQLLAALEALVEKVEERWHEEIKYAPVSVGQYLMAARDAIGKAKAQS